MVFRAEYIKRLCLGSCLLAIVSIASAQVKPDDILFYSKSASALKSKGNKAFSDGDFLLAQLYYEALNQKKPTEKYQLRLAKTYLKNKLYAPAENIFQKLIAYDKTTALYLAYTQITQGKYTEAKKNFEAFRKSSKGKTEVDEEPLYKSVQTILKTGAYNKKDSSITPKIVRLNTKVNGKLSEFTPFYLTDTSFFFGKTTPDEAAFFLKTDSAQSNIPVRKYFTGQIGENGEVERISPWSINNSDSSLNYGGACFNGDKTVFYFTQCERKFNALECHIYQTKKTTAGWSKPILLEGKINTNGYSSAQPSLGYDIDKKADVLYFSSNMPGAKGFDIYYAIYDKSRRQFATVSKCGPKVNSAGDEYTPFYSIKDSLLYFSSNGKGGFGGQDIFKTKGKLNVWTDAEALPKPINSAADDDYFSIDNTREKGFFASNRSSESSTAIKTCCDDIYAFYLHPVNEQKIKDSIAASLPKDVLVPLKIMFENGFTANDSAKLTVYEMKNGNRIPLYTTFISSTDTGLRFTADKQYKISVTSKHHLTETTDINLEKWKPSTTDTQFVTPKLIPRKPIIIPGINYEFDSSRLIPESIRKIDEYIYPLLVENPTLTFQLNSHTDSKGDANYNQKLSEQRAKKVVEYLTQVKGIAPERLKYKGYGESKPIAPNTLPNGDDYPEGRAQNRRTEFEVIGGIEQIQNK
jgi:outer membrane protein OmpA-like peptidoglycan-associated protein/tetratricopeptide (TPR) repeat protein